MPYIAEKLKNSSAILLILVILLLGGCREQGQQPPLALENQDKLTIGILPEINVFEQKKRYLPVMGYLSKKVNMNVKVKLLDSYGAVDGAFARGDIDGAFVGSSVMVRLYHKHRVEIIARPRYSGVSYYKASIIADRKSGATGDVHTWKGKKLALAHELTTTSIFVRWYLNKQGISDESQIFPEIEYAGSHDAVIILVLDGQAGIGAVKDAVIERFLKAHPVYKDRLLVLAESALAPTNTLAMRADLPAPVKSLLKKTLLEMHDNEQGRAALNVLGADRFIGTDYSEYKTIENMMHDLGIDPLTYPFPNPATHK